MLRTADHDVLREFCYQAAGATISPQTLLLIITPPILLDVQVTADFLVTVGGHPVPGRHQ